ncbi:MAG: aldehyde dehydrogenase family protein [Phycisphaerales bacterium]|nr:MAG: aldehyde dehydrogenase family protein [Phycisphaerales bacterium]
MRRLQQRRRGQARQRRNQETGVQTREGRQEGQARQAEGQGVSAAAPHPSLRHPACDIINGKIVPLRTGDAVASRNPARPAETVWSAASELAHVDEAVAAARAAFPAWAASTPDDRIALLRRFQQVARDRAEALAELICDETGKAWWESIGEAALIAGKVDITLDESAHSGLQRVRAFEFPMNETRRAACAFRPHGVMCVLGPFNFPAHLPNGHIVPALLAGNTIVFKPSDKTPGVGQMLAEMLLDAGFPAGVINLVQGGADIASRLASHDGVDGVLFTGSWPVGRRILEANLDRPGRIVALEMGGNNPAVVMDDADLRQAAIECARCAFNTTGQRCTSTRRVIVHERVAQPFVRAVCQTANTLLIGDPRGVGDGPRESRQPVFMGPIINAQSRDAVLGFQRDLARAGAEVLVESTTIDTPEGGFYITPGVARVDRFSLADDAGKDAGCDVEIFGPYLRISTTDSLDDAIIQANATRYGLSSSIFTRSEPAAARFLRESRAGCVNVNTGTAGASGKLPFGGLGFSGNHRPAGAFSLDYCAYPVATMIETGAEAQIAPGMTFDDSWVR